MMKRCVIDTNVMVTANKIVSAIDDDIVVRYPALVECCIKTLISISEKQVYVVLDEDDEIFNEYKVLLHFSGQPGVGDAFFKWLHDNRWSFPASERIKLHKTNDSYTEFPIEMEVENVDVSDKMFFAISNAHPAKPAILEAADTKWWKWKEAAVKCGISIVFMDEDYMRDHNPDMETSIADSKF